MLPPLCPPFPGRPRAVPGCRGLGPPRRHCMGQHPWLWMVPTDAQMTADMDASIPWNFNGPRPDFRLGDCHDSTADNMFCRVAGGDRGLTWFMVHDNQMINEGRHLEENVFSNVTKWRFWNGRDEAPGRPYDYDFLAGLFILCCNLLNMEQRYTESL